MIAHDIKSNDVSMELFDVYGMPIHDDNVFIIKQFKNCSHFFIEIRAKSGRNDINTLIEVSIMFDLRLCFHIVFFFFTYALFLIY